MDCFNETSLLDSPLSSVDPDNISATLNTMGNIQEFLPTAMMEWTDTDLMSALNSADTKKEETKVEDFFPLESMVDNVMNNNTVLEGNDNNSIPLPNLDMMDSANMDVGSMEMTDWFGNMLPDTSTTLDTSNQSIIPKTEQCSSTPCSVASPENSGIIGTNTANPLLAPKHNVLDFFMEDNALFVPSDLGSVPLETSPTN